MPFWKVLDGPVLGRGGTKHQIGDVVELTDFDAAPLLPDGFLALIVVDAPRIDTIPVLTVTAGTGAIATDADPGVEETEEVAEIPPPANSSQEVAEVTDSANLSLNLASLQELTALPHIGEAIAKKIIAARPLADLAAAKKASGLTAKQWSEIEGNLTV